MTETRAAAVPALSADEAARVERVARDFRSPMKLRAYFSAKLPLALFAGLKVRELTAGRCAVDVPYGWRTTNPFRSTYFAAQSMAAELSTGALVMLAVQSSREPVSMLVANMSASFEKKASDTLTFTCEDGADAFAAVRETLRTGEGVTVPMKTVGRLPDGTVAATFEFVWTMKKKAPKS